MYSITFVTHLDTGSKISTNIACPNYSVYDKSKDGCITITTYKGMTDEEGVERHLREDGFDECYVSIEGQTVNRYFAPLHGTTPEATRDAD